MSSIPIGEQNRFVAGDTVQWQITDTDFPSDDGWTLTYYFLRSGSRQTVAATAQTDGSHLVTITAAASALWAAGKHSYTGIFSKGTERYTRRSGEVEVLIDPAASTYSGGYDYRTHAQVCLDAIEAVLEGRATAEHESFQIQTPQGARAVRFIPIAELIKLRDTYRAEVQRERDAAGLRKGLGRSKILTRIGGV